uniref:T9SS type A sorting domain-containing protein n=1 Tax=Ignavibacterium album TaxID=591197 RepID=A0A7V3E8M7_9BACT
MDQSNPSGLALSNGFYKTDAVYAYPLNIRHSDAWIIVNLNDLYPDDNMIYATVGPDYIGYSPFYIPLLYMNDLEAGISVLGQGNPTLNPIKLTLLYFELVSNDDIYSEMDFYLDQNYPNPFNPTTVISWQSPVGSHQTLKVYDVLGNEVATLVNEYKEAGRHKVEFDASKLASGVYIYKLTAGSFTSSKKMMVVK